MSEMNCEARDGHRQVRTLLPFPERAQERHVALSPDHAARPVGRVGIIGATAVGTGIAMRLLDAGIPVTVFDRERASLDRTLATARSRYQDAVANGDLAAEARDRRLALLAATLHFHHLKDCDLLIDALATEIGAKEKLLRRLDEVAKPGAVLMTCDANCDIDHLARITRRQGEVLGLRFLSSANEIGAWECVRGRGTSEEALATASALVRNLQKANAADPARAAVLQ
jgi:3-hydroxyacyl-CoA dehydrogenase